MYKLRLNPVAVQDLEYIKNYIAYELLSPDAALNIVRKIVSDYKRIPAFPKMGQALSTRIRIPTDYRYLVSGNYIIFYKIENDYVSIYRVLHCKMDYVKILFDDQFENNDL